LVVIVAEIFFGFFLWAVDLVVRPTMDYVISSLSR
jgi:hypothetical protein